MTCDRPPRFRHRRHLRLLRLASNMSTEPLEKEYLFNDGVLPSLVYPRSWLLLCSSRNAFRLPIIMSRPLSRGEGIVPWVHHPACQSEGDATTIGSLTFR